MKRVLASELLHHVDQPVMLRGWLHGIRPFGKINFLVLRDRTGLSQAVLQDKKEYEKVAHLQPGAVLTITGTALASAQAELGVEVVNPTVTVEVPVTDVVPIDYYKPEINSDLEFILDNRALALRNRRIQAVFTIQSAIAHAYRLFMHDVIGGVEYFGPSIIGTSSEGGAEFFSVDYFGYTATLAQSSQLYKQIMVGVNERVYAVLPFFRAEKSNTHRHLTEGKQLEFEMGFFETWHELMDVHENCIKYILKYIHTYCAKELALVDGEIIQAPEHIPAPRVTFAEAQELFYQRTGLDERQENDLSPAAERELCRYAQETFGTDLIFVTDWKTEKRPFYAYPKDEDPSLTNTFDLLCGGTEISSGGQRRHTYSSMVEGILAKGMNPESFEEYLSIFKYGMPPHGGFGVGLERLTMTLLRLKNIREACLFPSDPKRIAGNRIKARIFFGAENIRNEIVRMLRASECEHQLVPETDPAALEALKLKALILRGRNSKKNYMLCIPGHRKLATKAVQEMIGERCEFEKPDVVQERFGLGIGAIPPFGTLLNLETFFDTEVKESQMVTFNSGGSSEIILMKSADLLELIQPKVGALAE